MKDSDTLDFVFGVVKQYTPDTGSEAQELTRRQAAIKGVKWLTWFIDDTNERKEGNTDENPEGSDLEKFEDRLMQYHGMPCSKSRLLEEFQTLREFALKTAQAPVSINTWWNLLHVSFERAFDLFLESRPACCQPSIEACLSLAEVILRKAFYAKRNSAALLDSFLRTCCTACRLLLHQRETDKAHFLSSLAVHTQESLVDPEEGEQDKYEEEDEEVTTSKPEITTTDLLYLTASCCSFHNPQDSLDFLSRIQSPRYPYVLTCFKVCLLHDSGEYDRALDLATSLTEDSIYKDLPSEIRSQLCDAMGSCLFNNGMHYVSVDWFGKSIKEDLTNVISQWHMANAYRKLENVNAERATLRFMAQRSSGLSASCSGNLSVSLPLAAGGQAGLSEALYILASRLQSAGLHQEATEHFYTFVDQHDFSETSEWVFVPKPTLAQIHVQTAHAHLQAGNYRECINSVKPVLEDFSDTSYEFVPGLFRKLVSQRSSAKPHLERRELLAAQMNSCFAALLKAVASIHTQEEEEAENMLRRILSVVSLLDPDGHVLEDNIRKFTNQKDSQDPGAMENHKRWLELVSQVYGNLSFLRLRKSLETDALHSLKASLLAWPDNVDSLYNYVLVLVRMNKTRKAMQVWNSAVDRILGQILAKDNISYWNFNVTLGQLKQINTILTS